MFYDVVVIGGGHAGCEAALACARMGENTLMLTLNIDSIALMPCNPAIGGTGKGHLVRELDALGGEMGRAIDDTFLQSRMLNTGKGPAVYSLRAQADKKVYQQRMRKALFSEENLSVRQGEAMEILTRNGRVTGVKTLTGDLIGCAAVVVCTGVYLKSRIIIGEASWNGGPQGLLPATGLSESLAGLGFSIRRFKTGTPARIDYRSIDFDKMEPQPGDDPITPFSFMTHKQMKNKMQCYLTWTNEHTHDIIRQNIHRAPMYSGMIHGTGARYCPSIEDKITRFADKTRHQLFIEPEGLNSPEWYVQGMSTSMPEDVQWQMYRSVKGLERAVLVRLAYAIEYDCIDPTALAPTFASLEVKGLFTAGQVNGTSGYEEAAAQGLLAGMNAALYLKDASPLLLTRDMAYIGVMADDLTTKGTDEPYRMMTSRAEHRLFLRQDNADFRLTELSHQKGLADDARMRRMVQKKRETDALLDYLKSNRQEEKLRRPETKIADVLPSDAPFSPAAREEAEILVKYDGYLQKEQEHIKKAREMEARRLPEDTPYMDIATLRIEARQKLSRQKPQSLGQASRIPGVSPADIAVLMVYLQKMNKEEKE